METYHPETTHLTATCSCEACAAFTRVAARTLAPSPIRDQLHRRLQPFRHLHDCSGCFRLERSPGGTCTHWKAPPSHGARKERSFPHDSANWPNRSKRKSGAARERIVPPRPISAVGRRALRVNRPCPVPDVLYQIPIRRPPWDFWRESTGRRFRRSCWARQWNCMPTWLRRTGPWLRHAPSNCLNFLKEKGFTGRRHSDLVS